MSFQMAIVNYEEVGTRIKALRRLHHYSRPKLAKLSGISNKFLYEIELGKKGFSADTLLRLSESLAVSCDYILCGEGQALFTDELIYLLESFNPRDREYIQSMLQILSDMQRQTREDLLSEKERRDSDDSDDETEEDTEAMEDMENKEYDLQQEQP